MSGRVPALAGLVLGIWFVLGCSASSGSQDRGGAATSDAASDKRTSLGVVAASVVDTYGAVGPHGDWETRDVVIELNNANAAHVARGVEADISYFDAGGAQVHRISTGLGTVVGVGRSYLLVGAPAEAVAAEVTLTVGEWAEVGGVGRYLVEVSDKRGLGTGPRGDPVEVAVEATVQIEARGSSVVEFALVLLDDKGAPVGGSTTRRALPESGGTWEVHLGALSSEIVSDVAISVSDLDSEEGE